MGALNVIKLHGVREMPRRAPKSVQSKTEAVILTRDAIDSWNAPPFQRPLRMNAKVMELAEGMKSGGGILPGILTLGVLDGHKYLVDGQHRIEAFKVSGLEEVYCEIRMCHFDTMADMADEFVTLNSKLVNMRPDDILRGLEATSTGLMALRAACNFVGYDMIRRGTTAPIVSMSAVLRCWAGAAQEVPSSSYVSAASLAKAFTSEDAAKLAQYLNTAHGAWGRDSEYYRLWGTLNLSLTMWLWRHLVMEKYSAKSVTITVQQFAKCMMSLSASSEYLDWLVGRGLSERDRGPCYSRIRSIFSARLEQETGKKAPLPSPAWFAGKK